MKSTMRGRTSAPVAGATVDLPLKRSRVVQNAYVVRDLEASCHRLHALLGIGPFFGNQISRFAQHRYRGREAPPIELRAVFASSGDLVIELIQVLSSGPSAFRDMYGPDEEGLHHVAVFADDYEAERDTLVAAGYPVASEFLGAPDCRVCMIDTRSALGHMLELYPDHPAIHHFYDQVRRAEGSTGTFAIHRFQ